MPHLYDFKNQKTQEGIKSKMIERKKTVEIKLGKLKIGGSNPIPVQSMLKNKINDHKAVRSEVEILQDYGCEIIRIAVPDKSAINDLKILIREKIFKVPVVGDIHFDHNLAIEALEAGVECVRINPGNIGSKERLVKVVEKAKEKKSAIRIGVNSGSIEKNILKKNRGAITDSLLESVADSVSILENLGFHNFKISAKASSVMDTVHIYKRLSEKFDYPLHLGITEAGPLLKGSIKSAVGIGILLFEGIGDTIRVSLTESSLSEVIAGFDILSSLDIRHERPELISCPTCGRTEVDLKSLVKDVEEKIFSVKKHLKIAVMGCIVNGPGEAKDADIGIAFGKKKAAIFVKGNIIKRSDLSDVLKDFEGELAKLLK